MFRQKPAAGPAGHKYLVRFTRADGHYREVNLRAADEVEAEAIACRRLREQYGDGVFEREAAEREAAGDGRELPEANLLRSNPDLHQDKYALDFVRRVDVG